MVCMVNVLDFVLKSAEQRTTRASLIPCMTFHGYSSWLSKSRQEMHRVEASTRLGLHLETFDQQMSQYHNVQNGYYNNGRSRVHKYSENTCHQLGLGT